MGDPQRGPCPIGEFREARGEKAACSESCRALWGLSGEEGGRKAVASRDICRRICLPGKVPGPHTVKALLKAPFTDAQLGSQRFPKEVQSFLLPFKRVREAPIHNPQLQLSEALFSLFWSLCCSGDFHGTAREAPLLLFLPHPPVISCAVQLCFSWLNTSCFLLAS